MMNSSKTQQVVYTQAPKQQQKKKTQRILHLKLEEKPKYRVSWTEDTINNQGMNKKKSNLCCIYHRPGQESSDTCTSDDQGNALERDRHTKHEHKKKCSKLNKKKQQKKNEVQKKEEQE